jgi:hypothetical protein
MYCPTCGKQISDSSRFCLHCGNPITQVIQQDEIATPANWEYKWFSWELKKGQGGHYDLHGMYGATYTEQSARLFFWNSEQTKVLPEFQKELDEGWQPLSEIGASAVFFENHNTWLELAAVKVKLRKNRTTPLQDFENALIGKWQRLQIETKSFGMKLLVNVTNIENTTISAVTFMNDKTFIVEYPPKTLKGTWKGTYRLINQSHILITPDPPTLRSTEIEVVNSELIIGKLRFKKI